MTGENSSQDSLTGLRRGFGSLINHPYLSRVVVALLYLYVFSQLLSSPFYPAPYILFFCTAITLLSMRDPPWAMTLGLLLTFPILFYQNLEFAMIYALIGALVMVVTHGDWRTGLFIMFSFVSAFNLHYSICMLTILLSGFLLGKSKGFLVGALSSILITLFALGFNDNVIGLFLLPTMWDPPLSPWIMPPEPFDLTNILNLNRYQFLNLTPIIEVIVENFSVIVQMLTSGIGGYLAGDVQNWRFKYNELAAMFIGALPLLFGFGFSELMLRNAASIFMSLGVPFIFIALLFSVTSYFWRPILFNLGAVKLEDLTLPEDFKNELKSIKGDWRTLQTENAGLKKRVRGYEENETRYEMLRSILEGGSGEGGTLRISSLSEGLGLDESTVRRILSELEREGFILLHRDSVFNKTWIRDRIRQRIVEGLDYTVE